MQLSGQVSAIRRVPIVIRELKMDKSLHLDAILLFIIGWIAFIDSCF